MIDECVPFGGYRCTTTAVPVDRSLLQHPDVIVPVKVHSGAMTIPDGSKRWNKYAHLVDREHLFSVHTIHPAWNEPFIVVKKPIFHVYEAFQLLGPEEIKTVIDQGNGTKLQDDKLGMISTISRETKEIILLLYYFEENPDVTRDAIEIHLVSPQKVAFGEKEGFFKAARCIPITPKTCTAFRRWNDEWSKLDAVNEAGLKALLEYNRLPMEEQHVDIEGETIVVKKEVEMNSVITLILKYD